LFDFDRPRHGKGAAEAGVEIAVVVRRRLTIGAADVERHIGPRPAPPGAELFVGGVFRLLLGIRRLNLGAPLPGIASHVLHAKGADRFRERADPRCEWEARLLISLVPLLPVRRTLDLPAGVKRGVVREAAVPAIAPREDSARLSLGRFGSARGVFPFGLG